jgi:hypothetical protein
MSTEAILSVAFAASDHQIHTPKFVESILSDLSNLLTEFRSLTMSISQFDSSKEIAKSASIIGSPRFLQTNVLIETMMIFDSAEFLSSEQIESRLVTRSNDLFMTKPDAPSHRIEDSGQLLSACQTRSSFFELSKNQFPTQELSKSILLLVSNAIAKSEELKQSTRIEYSARLMSTEAILSVAFEASDHQIYTQKFIESILCDLSTILAESWRFMMSISQFDSSKEIAESTSIVGSPRFLHTKVLIETMVLFDSAGFLSSEQIGSRLVTPSNDLLQTPTVGPSSSIMDSAQFLSGCQIPSTLSEMSKNDMPTHGL